MNRRILFAFALLLGACRESTEPGTPNPAQPAGGGQQRAVGLMEIKITNINSEQPVASVRAVYSPEALEAIEARKSGMPEGIQAAAMAGRIFPIGEHDGTIQLEPVSTGSFTLGPRPGGFRYVSATYRVRNAERTGANPYTSSRTNLTFMAVSTGAPLTPTISGTPFVVLNRFNNSAASESIAPLIVPTGAATLDQAKSIITTTSPDVLQIFTEVDAELSPPAGVTSVFPYGFVVRHSRRAPRTLDANPAAGQFDGLVTFAFKVPLQASVADDPFTIAAMFLAVDDLQTHLTQSPEERDTRSILAFQARANALTGLGSHIHPWDGQFVGNLRVSELICVVRTAGTVGTPTAWMTRAEQSAILPNGYPIPRNSGQLRTLTTSDVFDVLFDGAMQAGSPATFVVTGNQAGKRFVGQTYDPWAGGVLSSPTGAFRPGELVRVTLTGLLDTNGNPTCPSSSVREYWTYGVDGNETFSTTTLSSINEPRASRMADVNGDGQLDMIVLRSSDGLLSVRRRTAPLTYATVNDYSIGSGAYDVLSADFNGDARPDIVTVNNGSDNISVLMNDGSGGFAVTSYSSLFPQAAAIGDVNNDGREDIVVGGGAGVGQNVTVLLGDGTGSFDQAPESPFDLPNGEVVAIAMGDMNNDGRLDLVTGNGSDRTVWVLLGNGLGQFTPSSTSAINAANFGLINDVALGDVNSDGRLDILTANADGDPSGEIVSVLNSNVLTGGYGSPVSYGMGNAGTVALVDINADGALDMVTSSLIDEEFSFRLGDGSGFGAEDTEGAAGAISLDLADANGDGRVDVVISDGAGDAVRIFVQQP